MKQFEVALPKVLVQLFEEVPIGVSVFEVSDYTDPGALRLVTANAASVAALGVDINQFAGKSIREAFPTALETAAPAKMLAAVNSGESKTLVDYEYSDENISGGVYELTFVPLGDQHVASIYQNVTKRVAAEKVSRELTQLGEETRERVRALQSGPAREIEEILKRLRSEGTLEPTVHASVGQLEGAIQRLQTELAGIVGSQDEQ